MRLLIEEQVKLTSKDIEWKDGMNYAVVQYSNQSLSAQHQGDYEYSLSSLEDTMYNFDGDMYNVEYYYIVKRELEQSDNLLYTKEMYDKGELPKAGMKCVVNGLVYLCIGIDSRGYVVLEHSEDGGLIRLDSKSIYPVPTKQERIDKLKSDQRDDVCDILSQAYRGFLSPEYFVKGVTKLQDNGLLTPVVNSN